jgi:hypothetical protein
MQLQIRIFVYLRICGSKKYAKKYLISARGGSYLKEKVSHENYSDED